ncbi:hypothetical protein [Bradyrhizobium cosmicum]|uniref:hypothetical protein n=1 Tax=Bradyrhizobium cosmicum TaxID=1404864 RepID=UPI0028EE2E94|nr:hypothetical protein [Bradyrhizobium cosmicum]
MRARRARRHDLDVKTIRFAEVFLGMMFGGNSSVLSLDPMTGSGFALKDLVAYALGQGDPLQRACDGPTTQGPPPSRGRLCGPPRPDGRGEPRPERASIQQNSFRSGA